jgi:hypothetical protein
MIYRNRVNISADSNGAGGVVNTLPYAWPADVPINPGDIAVFGQSTAPTGFTKLTTHNNKALRIVSGTASAGGTLPFTTVFTSQTPTVTGLSLDSTTITIPTMPGHTHIVQGATLNTCSYPVPCVYYAAWNHLPPGVLSTSSSGIGGGLGHTHASTTISAAVPLGVNYVDIILAQKN